MRMRGTTSSTPGTASAMAAASRCETPSDFWRISFSSLVLERLGADQDVAQAEPLDRGQGLALGPVADRHHGDHRADAEDHAEHGQRRAQLVRRQVVERRAEGFAAGVIRS